MLIRCSLNAAEQIICEIMKPAHFSNPTNSFFATQNPIFLYSFSEVRDQEEVAIDQIQNEVSGVKLECVNDVIQNLTVFSAKLSRSRLFYTFYENSIWLSDDLRALLPYSSRELNRVSAYAILKFGELPEYKTIVDDIFAVPGAHLLVMNNTMLKDLLYRKEIPREHFKPYFTIRYTDEGGDLNRTRSCLTTCLNSLQVNNPKIFVSGGIDSTLLNHLYDSVTESKYQALFLDFDEAPEELAYAKQSVKGTKAEFTPIRLTSDSLEDDFLSSIKQLIYPVYDNGSALVGYQLRKYLGGVSSLENMHFIDGTLADSCYGVRNYNKPITVGKKQFRWVSELKEFLYMQVILSGKKWDGTNPRDAYLDDEFLQDLLWNGGPFINFWFFHAEEYTLRLKHEYFKYYELLGEANQNQYWPRYTILKMLLYAAKQTTVKMYDMLLPGQVYFPFMFKSVVEDQGKYTWSQKSEGNIIKAPLKKILETYIDKDFIYRKKVGLQSQTIKWIQNPSMKRFIDEVLFSKNGVAIDMMGGRANYLRKAFAKETVHPAVASLVLSMTVIQTWCTLHNVHVNK